MKKLLIAGCVSATLFVTTFVGAFADQPASTKTIGTPGEANCVGETTAFLAQAAKASGVIPPGLGNLADFNNLSVKDLKAVIDAYCNP